MPEDKEKFRYPVKEIYVKEATFLFSPKELQERENIILEGIKKLVDEVEKTGQIRELKCYSSHPKELAYLGKYAVIKEVIINEVFKELGIREKEKRMFRGEKETITLWPTKEKGVFAVRLDGEFEGRQRYRKGIVVAGPGKKVEDIAREFYKAE